MGAVLEMPSIAGRAVGECAAWTAQSGDTLSNRCRTVRSRTESRHRVGSTSGVDHPGTDGDPGGLVDEDERPRGAVLRVGVAQQGHRGAERDAADLVQAE